MDQLMQGFINYEFVLLVLGVALFLVLLTGLLLMFIRKKEVKRYYLLAFFIPVVMIVYPSIQRISFLNDLITLEKVVKEATTESDSEEAKEHIEEVLQSVEQRPVSSTDDQLTIAKAYLQIDNLAQAEKYVESVLKKDSNHVEALKIRAAIEKRRNFNLLKKKYLLKTP